MPSGCARPSIVVTALPARLHGENGAGLDRLAVEMDDAAAALRRVATDMGAGEFEMIAQEFGEQGTGFDLGAAFNAIDGQFHFEGQMCLRPKMDR